MPDGASPGERDEQRLTLTIDEEGVAFLTFERSGGGSSLLTVRVLRRVDTLLAEAEAEIDAGRIRALVVRGGAPGSFLAGTDLAEVQALASAREATAKLAEGQQVLRRLERLPVPSVAAIDGPCLGSGLALALACAHRVAADAPYTLLGFPEIRVGIIPGFGATVRLPRLIGVQRSVDLVLSGRQVGADEARQLGLVDEVAPPEEMPERSRAAALAAGERGRGRGGRRGVGMRVLEDTAPGRRLVFARAARRLVPRAPMPGVARRALEVLADGVSLPLERAFQRESEVLGEMVVSEAARGLLHASRLVRGAPPARPAPAGGEAAGVLGAGEEGSTLALLLASGGVPVRLKDRGRAAVVEGLRRAVSTVGLEGGELERVGTNLAVATGFGGFGTLGVVVLAVGRDPDTLAAALAQAEDHTTERCVIACLSPALPMADVQARARHPARVVGLHLAPPAAHFALLEIVPGPATGPAALDACRALARRIGFGSVTVRDERATPAQRLLGLYLAEATRLLEEGATPALIDGTMEEFGMALGPLHRADAMGVRSAARLLDRLGPVLGDRARPAPLFERLAEAGSRFYRYERGRPVGPSTLLPRGVPEPGPAAVDLVRRRILLLLVAEGVRILEEGVVDTPAAVDLVSLQGLGFPRPRGGLLHHADRIGIPALVADLQAHAARFGDRYAPPALLERLAREGTGLHPPARSSGHRPDGVL
jgi:3-hydroxyacyl-CoA dehydrogenase / enoyl-CoA hydratase / 3-hydroxybutyryl-CoA epimerase